MEKKEIKEKIKAALKRLGIKGYIKIEPTSFPHLFEVYLNKEYFGIFDTKKNTFVD